MKAKEVRELSPEEISTKVDQFRKQGLEMKMQIQTNPGAVKNAQLSQIRRIIARLLTVQQERHLGLKVSLRQPKVVTPPAKKKGVKK